jgi:RHS repeat-associated protein
MGIKTLTVVQQQQQTGGNTVANKEIDYAYNALGQFTAMAYFDELSGPRTDIATGAFSYDNDNRLTGLAYTADGGQNTIDTFGWAYNAGSLVTSFTTDEGTASYGYDPTNQLTSASYTGTNQPANESYAFTANGNRKMSGYSTGSDNLTSSDGTYNYLYDADGNLVKRTQIANTYSADYTTTYTWDYRNRLTDVENYDNNGVLTQHVHYVYDVFDHLLATEVDTTGDGTYNVIDHYVLDVTPEIPAAGVPGTLNAQPVLVFNGSEALIGRNLVAPNAAGIDAVDIEGTVTATNQPDTDQYNLFDDLGSDRVILNSASAVVDLIDYNSVGVIAYESSPTIAHFAGFAGGHVDYYTGLTNDYHRWYDPATGKWLSEDPDGFAGGDPNLYRYVANSALNETDSTGLFAPPNPSPTPTSPQQTQQQQGPPKYIFLGPNNYYQYNTTYPIGNCPGYNVKVIAPTSPGQPFLVIVYGPNGEIHQYDVNPYLITPVSAQPGGPPTGITTMPGPPNVPNATIKPPLARPKPAPAATSSQPPQDPLVTGSGGGIPGHLTVDPDNPLIINIRPLTIRH